jgi:epoxide hydrolase-like predicted phosphatase
VAFRAAIFDLGGVVLGSPLQAIRRFELDRGLPEGLVNRVVVETGPDGAWARLERGELDLRHFHAAFEAECSQVGHSLCAADLMAAIGDASAPREAMLEAVRRIRDRGLTAAALTNNWAGDGEGTGVLRPHFDAFFESSLLGLRKPDPRIYTHACEALGVLPEQVVFLDDIGRNLKPARALGMTTLKVDDPGEALLALEALLGFALRAAG